MVADQPFAGPETALADPPASARVIDPCSPAGLVMTMLDDAQRLGRLSSTECAIVHALLWHPDFPAHLRDQAGLVGMATSYFFVR